ncbi:MAG: sigma-70 family RNA polymerase sigma factor [Oscillospiraceae bacterium]
MCVNYGVLSDEALIAQVDVSYAFAELELRYLWLVRAKVGAVSTWGTADREDLLQEGLLSLYYAAKTYKTGFDASFSTYAAVCIYNRLSNVARSHKSKKNALLNNSVSLEDVDSSVPSPEMDLEHREDFEAVLNQIHISLSDFERKVLGLYLGGYKRTEISEKYGVSVKAFDNAMGRVRKKLKSGKVGSPP